MACEQGRGNRLRLYSRKTEVRSVDPKHGDNRSVTRQRKSQKAKYPRYKDRPRCNTTIWPNYLATSRTRASAFKGAVGDFVVVAMILLH